MKFKLKKIKIKKTVSYHVGAGSGLYDRGQGEQETPLTQHSCTGAQGTHLYWLPLPLYSIMAPAYWRVHTGQMLSGIGNSLSYILKGKPASMLPYTSRYFSGKPSSGHPAPQAHYLSPLHRCIATTRFHVQLSQYVDITHGKPIRASPTQQQIQCCSESKSKSILRLNVNAWLGIPPEQKQAPSFQGTEAWRTRNPVAVPST